MLSFDSAIEVITPQFEKIQFTNSGEALLSRPDKLRAHRVGGYAGVAMVFDGKTVGVYGKNLNAYAQFEGPGTLGELIEALRVGHGASMPGGDLLLSNPYDALIAGVLEAKYIGRGVIDGVECEHLAIRNVDADWQRDGEIGLAPDSSPIATARAWVGRPATPVSYAGAPGYGVAPGVGAGQAGVGYSGGRGDDPRRAGQLRRGALDAAIRAKVCTVRLGRRTSTPRTAGRAQLRGRLQETPCLSIESVFGFGFGFWLFVSRYR